MALLVVAVLGWWFQWWPWHISLAMIALAIDLGALWLMGYDWYPMRRR